MNEITDSKINNEDNATESRELLQEAHRCLARVDAMYDNLRFNSAIAQIHALVNVLETAIRKAGANDLPSGLWESAELTIQMFAPVMPHLAEECWKTFGVYWSCC